MSKTHYKRFMNPDYLGAYSLPEGEDMTVVIEYVQSDEVAMAGGKKEVCMVARMIDQKPMILNATNSKTIAKLYGPYVEDWQGKPITLFASTTRFGGETVECLRIRPQVAPRAKPPITEVRLAKAIEAIKAGTYDIGNVRKNFALTAEQDKRLLTETRVAEVPAPESEHA